MTFLTSTIVTLNMSDTDAMDLDDLVCGSLGAVTGQNAAWSSHCEGIDSEESFVEASGLSNYASGSTISLQDLPHEV